MTEIAKLPPGYTSPRHDVVELVPRSARRILELGCSNGSTALVLQQRQECSYTGIERDSDLAAQARSSVIGEVLVRSLDDSDWPRDLAGSFDCIIAADILEHLVDPWSVLRQAVSFLEPGGCVVISLPNAGHVQTILNLVRGRWPYRQRGVHDATHLRFFTLREIRGLCGFVGLRINHLTRNRRILDRGGVWDYATRITPVFGFSDLFTYQYVLRASVSSRPERVPAESVPPWHRQGMLEGVSTIEAE